MVESLVQWTLLNNRAALAEMLHFDIASVVGQEITTDYGRLDFVLANLAGQQLVVELETELNSSSKLDFCFAQTLRYKNVRFADETSYCILYADETNPVSKRKIATFCQDNNVLGRTYSLERAKHLYSQTVERLSLNVGLALPNPKNCTICYLRWLNKILKPFRDAGKDVLSFAEMYAPFDSPSGSRTNFNCHERLAVDFEMLQPHKGGYQLTTIGSSFVETMSPYVSFSDNVSSIPLTNPQKRLLLQVLTNGDWENKVHKVNIYWFLRFVEVTRGSWLPKKHEFEPDKLEIANGLFNVSYGSRTMHEFLTWCCNYCMELGLAERVKSTSQYDEVILTPLGIDVNNIFSADLILKRSRMNLNFKYLD